MREEESAHRLGDRLCGSGRKVEPEQVVIGESLVGDRGERAVEDPADARPLAGVLVEVLGAVVPREASLDEVLPVDDRVVPRDARRDEHLAPDHG
jgi:hypothetical protein